ncbi:site-specific DNA-methyltransferase [Janthinobacterium sp.]|uniref:site-specific DNA-methyltransferase n=1 Tax=Janthinobacterium sp. TaxID=1871054 RepID=UPI0025C1844F|nr:site-specific DNA-methyltransferase [Janthinobacterium sp.]NBV15770.1 site-specific DNA-methyltransferase [Janthinobacterium sp.]
MKNTNTPMQESLQLTTPNGGTTNVEKYEFEPIKGFPMLNWRGKRPFTSTQYYPAQLKEIHGEEVDGWRNKIFWGDNLQVMSHLLKEFRGKVDLIYIDPPFDSKADYRKQVSLRGNKARGDQAAFEEKQYGDIWTNDEYLQFLYERLLLLRELLSPTGAIFLHCDWHKNHHIRCLLDEIFGQVNFCNEIARIKSNPKNSDLTAFGNIHDTVLFYRKGGDNYAWTPLREEKDSEDLVRIFEKVDGTGRRFTTVALHAPGERAGQTGQPWRGLPPPRGRHWAYVHSQLDHFDTQGKIEWSSSGNPRLIRYADEDEGNRVQDVWTMKDPQYVDYPTEKTETLLERIILACSRPGELVLDCFMGSGTTQAVAMQLGRRFIGADINLGAIQTTTKRLLGIAEELRQKSLSGETKSFTGFELHNVNHYDIFRNPVQAKELLIEALEVQKLEFNTVFDGEKDGRMVKIMPVNRIATRADLNELIHNFDQKTWQRRHNENPNRAVEKITLVCMGHEPDLAAQLILVAKPFKIDVKVVDILRDKADLEFRRDSEAKVAIKEGELVIVNFYPMNLLQKLSLQKEVVDDWRELTESVLIDWNYDGAVLQPTVLDIPSKGDLVRGIYNVPDNAGTIRVKITDLLSESWEGSVGNGD